MMDYDVDATQVLDLGIDDQDEASVAKKEVGKLKTCPHKMFREEQYIIYEGANIIGRDDRSDIVIKVQSVSKKHACIEVENGTFLVYDFDSRNKSRKGQMLLKPYVRYELNDGDKLTFGDLECEFIANPIEDLDETKSLSGSETGSESLIPEDEEEVFQLSAGQNCLVKNDVCADEKESLQNVSAISDGIILPTQFAPADLNTSGSSDSIILPTQQQGGGESKCYQATPNFKKQNCISEEEEKDVYAVDSDQEDSEERRYTPPDPIGETPGISLGQRTKSTIFESPLVINESSNDLITDPNSIDDGKSSDEEVIGTYVFDTGGFQGDVTDSENDSGNDIAPDEIPVVGSADNKETRRETFISRNCDDQGSMNEVPEIIEEEENVESTVEKDEDKERQKTNCLDVLRNDCGDVAPDEIPLVGLAENKESRGEIFIVNNGDVQGSMNEASEINDEEENGDTKSTVEKDEDKGQKTHCLDEVAASDDAVAMKTNGEMVVHKSQEKDRSVDTASTQLVERNMSEDTVAFHVVEANTNDDVACDINREIDISEDTAATQLSRGSGDDNTAATQLYEINNANEVSTTQSFELEVSDEAEATQAYEIKDTDMAVTYPFNRDAENILATQPYQIEDSEDMLATQPYQILSPIKASPIKISKTKKTPPSLPGGSTLECGTSFSSTIDTILNDDCVDDAATQMYGQENATGANNTVLDTHYDAIDVATDMGHVNIDEECTQMYALPQNSVNKAVHIDKNECTKSLSPSISDPYNVYDDVATQQYAADLNSYDDVSTQLYAIDSTCPNANNGNFNDGNSHGEETVGPSSTIQDDNVESGEEIERVLSTNVSSKKRKRKSVRFSLDGTNIFKHSCESESKKSKMEKVSKKEASTTGKKSKKVAPLKRTSPSVIDLLGEEEILSINNEANANSGNVIGISRESIIDVHENVEKNPRLSEGNKKVAERKTYSSRRRKVDNSKRANEVHEEVTPPDYGEGAEVLIETRKTTRKTRAKQSEDDNVKDKKYSLSAKSSRSKRQHSKSVKLESCENISNGVKNDSENVANGEMVPELRNDVLETTAKLNHCKSEHLSENNDFIVTENRSQISDEKYDKPKSKQSKKPAKDDPMKKSAHESVKDSCSVTGVDENDESKVLAEKKYRSLKDGTPDSVAGKNSDNIVTENKKQASKEKNDKLSRSKRNRKPLNDDGNTKNSSSESVNDSGSIAEVDENDESKVRAEKNDIMIDGTPDSVACESSDIIVTEEKNRVTVGKNDKPSKSKRTRKPSKAEVLRKNALKTVKDSDGSVIGTDSNDEIKTRPTKECDDCLKEGSLDSAAGGTTTVIEIAKKTAKTTCKIPTRSRRGKTAHVEETSTSTSAVINNELAETAIKTKASKSSNNKNTASDKTVRLSYRNNTNKIDESEKENEHNSSTETPGTPRRHVSKPKVIFTGMSDKTAEKIVTDLGGEVVDSVFAATHLVTDKVRRTVKFLCAVARGIHVVHPQWLISSKASKVFTACQRHTLNDEAAERQYKFQLRVTLEKACENPLFLHKKVYVTKNVKPERAYLKEMIESAGGTYLARVPRSPSDDIIVVSCAEDEKEYMKLEEKGFVTCTKEIILTGLLRQNLDTELFSIHNLDELNSSQMSISDTSMISLSGSGSKKRMLESTDSPRKGKRRR